MLNHKFLIFTDSGELNLSHEKQKGFIISIGVNVNPIVKTLGHIEEKKAYLDYITWVGYYAFKIANQELFNSFMDGLDHVLMTPKPHQTRTDIAFTGSCKGQEVCLSLQDNGEWVGTIGDQGVSFSAKDVATASIKFLAAIAKDQFKLSKSFANHNLAGGQPLPEKLA